MSRTKQWTTEMNERAIGREQDGKLDYRISADQISFDRFRRYLFASTLAVSVVIAGLCSFIILASMAAWTVLAQ